MIQVMFLRKNQNRILLHHKNITLQKCDCGYMVESHVSMDDAINKLFAAGHGNSYEHSGYVAGGDLD